MFLLQKKFHCVMIKISLSLYFNVIHYSNPEANKAMFILENYDKVWRPAGSEYTAYYYNIPPGHYIFRIKAASSYGCGLRKISHRHCASVVEYMVGVLYLWLLFLISCCF
jgi:hypothetical protein